MINVEKLKAMKEETHKELENIGVAEMRDEFFV